MKQVHRRLSYGNLVATLALFITLGGTGYAAVSLPKNSVGTKQLKSAAVTSAKIKNGAVTARKLNLTGVTVPNALHANRTAFAAHASTADNASHAGSADNASHASSADTSLHTASADTAGHASTADNAANAQPTAFAHITANGGLIAADSKNVGSVTKAANNTYCLRGIPFTVRGGQATVDGLDLVGGFPTTKASEFGIGDDSGFCPNATQAFVLAGDRLGNGARFFVELYG